MRTLLPTLLLLLVPALDAQAPPRLTISATQIVHGESVTVRATGFTPKGVVLSRLVRPDGSEYPEMPLEADARGEFSHLVTIVPENFGTYEIQITDERSKAGATKRFLLVPAGHPPALKGQTDRTPAAYTGVWEGSVVQKSQTAPADVVVTLAGGTPGAVVGTVSYPSSSCGGELWLIAALADSVQLGETITFGQDRCRGRAIVTASLTRDGRLEFQWRDVLQSGSAMGTLKRRTELN